MGETDRNEELMPVLGRQFRADPLAIGGRALAHIDRDVEDAPADAAHQLVLSPVRRLKMQAAQREGGCGVGMIVLHEGAIDAEPGEGGHRMDLGEPATAVTEAPGTDELDGGCGGHVA